MPSQVEVIKMEQVRRIEYIVNKFRDTQTDTCLVCVIPPPHIPCNVEVVQALLELITKQQYCAVVNFCSGVGLSLFFNFNFTFYYLTLPCFTICEMRIVNYFSSIFVVDRIRQSMPEA
jgi:hypothetical protein